MTCTQLFAFSQYWPDNISFRPNGKLNHAFTFFQEMKPLRKLYRTVRKKIKRRAVVEDLAADDHIKDQNSPYFNNVLMFGMKVYAFYTCNVRVPTVNYLFVSIGINLDLHNNY